MCLLNLPTFYSTQLSPDILQIHALWIYACSFRLRVDSGKYNWTNECPGRLEVHVYCTSLSCSSCQQSYPLILLEIPSFANMSSSSIWTSEFKRTIGMTNAVLWFQDLNTSVPILSTFLCSTILFSGSISKPRNQERMSSSSSCAPMI
jgi:hypothetical protein